MSRSSRRLVSAFALAFALLVIAAPVTALDERAVTQFVVRAWGPEQGLPSASGYALAQTPDGYLWIGTTEGLARFDGFRFRVFDRRNTPAFSSNEVRRLLVMPDGALIVGMSAGGIVRVASGRFEALIPRDEERDLLTALAIAPDGGLLAAWLDRMARVAPGRLEPIAVPGVERINRMARSTDGTIWVADDRSRVVGLTPGGGRRELLLPSGLAIASSSAFDSFGDELWTVTASGLLRCRGAECRRWGPQLPGVAALVSSLSRGAEGDLWASFGVGGGLARVRESRVEPFGIAQGSPADRVQELLVDREGLLWAMSWDAGLLRLADGPFTSITRREGLAGDSARTLLESRDGTIWVGTTQGLSRFDGSRWRSYGTADGLPAEWVYSLAEEADGTLWVGTRAGLAVRRGDRFEPVEIPGNDRALIFSLLADREGRLWVGADTALLLRERGAFRAVPMPEAIPFALHEDRRGRIWIGTRGGLFEIEPGSEVPAPRATATRFRNLVVFSIHEDSRGDLWFGTLEGGLQRLHGDRFDFFSAAEGLFDDTAFAILEDDRANLWISCAHGIYRLALADVDAFVAGSAPRLKCRAFGVDDGLATRVAEGGNGGAGLRSRDGRLWFATMKGVGVLDPRRVAEPPVGPPVLLESVRVDGVERAGEATLRLAAGRYRLEIEYTAIHQRSPERLRFRHRLEGVDADWVTDGTTRRAEYPGLGHGEYRFEVQAAVADGAWGPVSALAMGVAPELWERASFLPAVALLAAVAGAGLLRMRLVRLRRRARELEAMADFGRGVAGVLEPEEIVRQLDRALVERWGEAPRLLLARREGRAALVHHTALAIDPPPLPEASALADWSVAQRLISADRSDEVGTEALRAAGLALAAPLRSGNTTFGLLAVGSVRGAADAGDLPHLGALAAQTAMALEGAWQAQEAVRWRQLSEARGEWLQSDLVSRLVFAVVARHALAGQATEAAVRQALATLLGGSDPTLARVGAAIERLVAARVLARDDAGGLRVERASWLLLPEIRLPLPEIARQGTQVVGAYRLAERIGAGGMGEVFRAVNVHDGSPAAVKLLFPEQTADATSRRRLEREGEIVAAISHPNVVRLLERGEHEGRLYLAMELLQGETLADRLRRGALGAGEAAAMGRQVALALAELHRRGVVHRDVKSGNVMIEPDGRSVLLDLGLARGLGGSSLTQSLAVLGTLPYMAPEQLNGGEADARSDLWSLGVVLAEALLGRLPFGAGQHTVQMALEIARLAAPPPLPELAHLPAALRSLLAALLEPEPRRRLASADEVGTRLALCGCETA